ncbi:hypothetical protein EU537_05035 [Candidatus Thorarchaeota archaeon]|nr:MAG: hypothetical protein EU537_05035 [Candidatus Thorarchaeota archaeon]
MQFAGTLPGIFVQIAFVIAVVVVLIVIWFKGSVTQHEILGETIGLKTRSEKSSVISKKTIPRGVSETSILDGISELSDYIEQIPFSVVEEWSEKIAEKELDKTLNKIHSLAERVSETPDEIEMALDTVRKRFQQARREIKTRSGSESHYYQLVVNLNRAIVEAKTKDASEPEQIESVRDALQKVESYNAKPYFSMQLRQRAERARIEAEDLLPSRI